MRSTIPALAALALAACTSTPRPVAAPAQPVAAQPRSGGPLIGLTAGELSARLGEPLLRVREGEGTKLQFRDRRCVLDAYLYSPPGGSGAPRVTHVDARDREGRALPAPSCLAVLEAR